MFKSKSLLCQSGVNTVFFFSYKNIFYKNIKPAEIWEISKIFLEINPRMRDFEKPEKGIILFVENL